MMTGPSHAEPFAPSTLAELPPLPATIHFIGIGGISMSGLAGILHGWGYTISGSDSQRSAVTAGLEELGIRVQIGHAATDLAAQSDILVVTPRAIVAATPEITAAVANGADVVRRGQLLGLLANARRSIAVAGSHGKSSTSGMIASALTAIGTDPSYSVGAVVGLTGRSSDAGQGVQMVVEADEFDRALLWLTPEVGIVTTVSFDHPDHYRDQADYDQVFLDFARGIRPGGVLVTSADDLGCGRLRAVLGSEGPTVWTFGAGDDADWRHRGTGESVEIVPPEGVVRPVRLKVPGRHNAANAAAAVMAMTALGVTIEDAIRGVEAYTGVGRRFEHKGTVDGIDVIDDYGHHPEEIEATVAAARDRYPGRRILLLFQPHTYSRTAILLDAFAAALSTADVPMLLEIFPAGETDSWGVSSGTVAALMPTPAPVIASPEDAVARLAAEAQPGDVVMTMGAGDVTMVGARLLERLRGEHREASDETPAPRQTRPRRTPRAPVRTIPLPGTDASVQRDAPMSLHTTMRIGGNAEYLVRASTPDLLEAALGWAASEGLPVTVIGGGSNLLVSDRGIPGLVVVVRTTGQKAEELIAVEDRGEAVLVTVGAQAPISWVGRFCAERGWSGMDWAVGLPGQVGGATVNNAGAHGTEIKDHLVEVDAFVDGELRTLDRAWLEPTYRMTRIKGSSRPRPWTVVRSRFLLPRGDREALVALADEHARFRRETQPTGACSGSTFANPPGDHAGRLLEQAGMKGFGIGAMQFSPKHANWVMNTGDGSAEDAWALIRHAHALILERDGIDLHPEIERVGAFDE